MKRVLGVLLLVAACFLGLTMTGTAQKADVRDGVFIHISSADPHRVLMAFQMAVMMAEKRDVIVYLDIQGIEVVLKDAPDISFSHFPSSRTQIKKLAEMGIGMYACPGCLKAAGKTPGDLMAEVKPAERDAFFDFTKGRILTLDY